MMPLSGPASGEFQIREVCRHERTPADCDGLILPFPAIPRKTDKGLPRYCDVDESDVFILSGVEDLVPVLRSGGTRFEDDKTFPGYVIHRYCS
jgi:hypothetical protein